MWIYDPVHFKTFAMGLVLGKLRVETGERILSVGTVSAGLFVLGEVCLFPGQSFALQVSA